VSNINSLPHILVGSFIEDTFTLNQNGSWDQVIQPCHPHGQGEPSLTLVPSSSWGSLVTNYS
jgi:hypothetical protein